MAGGGKLPQRMERYFWEVDVDRMDLEKHKNYVIERVLDWGKTDDVKWLLARYGKEGIKEALRQRRGLSRSTAVFWADMLDLDKRKEVACLKKEELAGSPWRF